MNSYLIWAALQRKIIGISLWVPVPFYMVNVDDFKACYQILDFLNQRLILGLDTRALERATTKQTKKIEEMANNYIEVKDIFHKLEANITLNQSESNRIVEIFEEQLK
jgi:predicted ATP-grasp superfamily ATP-dependent carboligase